MLTIRKIDWYGQVVLGALMGLSVPFFLAYGFLLGLFFLGVWQLVSAGLNTVAFIGAGQMREIINYWRWAALDLGFMGLCISLPMIINRDDVQVFTLIGIICSIPIALFYIVIYRKLVRRFEMRKTLSSIIKSKP
jgi:hypothetical protein